MNYSHTVTFVAVVLGLACFIMIVGRWLERRERGREARRRGAHAVWGEQQAVTMLADLGYRVLDEQATLAWSIFVDDEPFSVDLRADLLVERDGRRYVAEVKTGEFAPRLDNVVTRRQLLEYQVAYAVDSVLLVDVDAGTVSEVSFPIEAP